VDKILKVDIICPLYNAENDLRRLDNSLKIQNEVDIRNISYILTKCNDKTEDILKELEAKYTVIERATFSHSYTREEAAFKSKADIIVFITQDVVIVDKFWLRNLIRPIENNECEASFSRQICNNNTIEKYTREFNYPLKSYLITKDDVKDKGLKAFFFSDASGAIKRDIFVKLNGYDNKKLPISEDMYFAYKLITNGYRIKYCSDSKVIHSHVFKLKDYYDRYKLTGKFFKQNSYLDKYGTTKSGGGMAKYILNRAIQDKNLKVIIAFLPNMLARFIGMKVGKLEKVEE
jgi:rhamnosyltransferase